jgi:hypothetical protein
MIFTTWSSVTLPSSLLATLTAKLIATFEKSEKSVGTKILTISRSFYEQAK